MSDDLVSRLSETLDEAERLALQARGHQWVDRHNPVFQGLAEAETGVPVVSGAESVLPHIARWDPQAVRRLIAALREIIAKLETALEDSEPASFAGEVLLRLAHGLITEEGD